ncbi:MAG: alpha-amylase family glycosyl hydrolase, partial [Thermoleophilaceae bacterium]
RLGQRPDFSMNRPEVHELLKDWRRLCDGYDEPRVLVGETWVCELERLAAFYGRDGDELHLAMNFVFILARFDAARLAAIVASSEAAIPPEAWPVWALSNHDLSRFPSRWAADDPRLVRCLIMLLLALRGTPIIYYGDELGMPNTHVPPDRVRDHLPEGGSVAVSPPRDRSRTPMPWSPEPGGGFTDADVEPWLPFGDLAATNVADQRQDPGSLLNLCRAMIALRRRHAELRTGAYAQLAAPDGVWAFRRGAGTTVALNLCDRGARLTGVEGEIQVASDRAREGERLTGELELRPWEGMVAG